MMQEKEIVFLNGEFINKNEAKISIFDRGFIFGDGIYEVIPILNTKIVDKIEFWDRFERSLKAIELILPYEKKEFESLLQKLVDKNNLKEGGIYIQITIGVASRDFAFVKNLNPTIVAFVYEDKIINNPLAKIGVNIISVPDLRWKRRDIKSISLLAQCYAKEKVAKAKAYEGFMIENGKVTEATSASAFIIKNQTLITKPLSNEILPGIRRSNILNFAKELELKIDERAFDMDEVYLADEVFVSAASLPILGVVRADDKIISNGKVGILTNKLRQKYIEKMQKESL